MSIYTTNIVADVSDASNDNQNVKLRKNKACFL